MLTEGTYRNLIASYRGNQIVADIPRSLVPLWCDDYRSGNPGAELIAVDLDNSGTVLTYLFDINLQRTIVAYGVPIFAKHARDSGRMAGHPNSAGRTSTAGILSRIQSVEAWISTLCHS
jgi:hypothetical protein